MANSKLVVPGDKLSVETLMSLFAEAEVACERGPEEMNNVMVDMGGIPFLIDPYPQHGAIKIWTAREIDSNGVEFARAVNSANSFNQTFLFVRNFVFQDAEDPSNYRAIWDCDRMVSPDGLTSEELMMTLSKVAAVMHEALGGLAEDGQTKH